MLGRSEGVQFWGRLDRGLLVGDTMAEMAERPLLWESLSVAQIFALSRVFFGQRLSQKVRLASSHHSKHLLGPSVESIASWRGRCFVKSN